MWRDCYLRAADEVAFAAALPEGWEVGPVVVDVLGQYDSGFLVNVRVKDGTALPDGLAALEIAAPAYPKRAFA